MISEDSRGSSLSKRTRLVARNVSMNRFAALLRISLEMLSWILSALETEKVLGPLDQAEGRGQTEGGGKPAREEAAAWA